MVVFLEESAVRAPTVHRPIEYPAVRFLAHERERLASERRRSMDRRDRSRDEEKFPLPTVLRPRRFSGVYRVV
jgi:hypothetical protein